WTPEEGVARVHALLRQLEARGPSPGLARLYTTLAELVGSSGHDDDHCLVAADRAVALARVVQDAYVLGRAEWHRGMALLGLGRLEEAQRALEAAIAQAEAVNDLATLADALNIVGCVYEDRGAFARSHLYAERALAIA